MLYSYQIIFQLHCYQYIIRSQIIRSEYTGPHHDESFSNFLVTFRTSLQDLHFGTEQIDIAFYKIITFNTNHFTSY